VHDSTTLEPTYEDFFSFFREVNVPTPMETSHDNPLGELFLSPTSHTSIFRSIHPNEVWVKGLFVMVSHEEYETPISPFDDDTIREPYLLHLQQHPFLHYDDRHLYGCTYGGDSSFTSWMKEHIADYIDAHYIFLEHNYGTYQICHWEISNILLDACVYGPHGDLLTWMYTHFHDSLMRYLLSVHLHDVVMYFNELYFVLMMLGRVKYQQWDSGISWFHLTWSSSLVVGLRKQTNLSLFEFIFT